jgi:hypothetical protein
MSIVITKGNVQKCVKCYSFSVYKEGDKICFIVNTPDGSIWF